MSESTKPSKERSIHGFIAEALAGQKNKLNKLIRLSDDDICKFPLTALTEAEQVIYKIIGVRVTRSFKPDIVVQLANFLVIFLISKV